MIILRTIGFGLLIRFNQKPPDAERCILAMWMRRIVKDACREMIETQQFMGNANLKYCVIGTFKFRRATRLYPGRRRAGIPVGHC